MENVFVRLKEVRWNETERQWSPPITRVIQLKDILGWDAWECRTEEQRSSTPTTFTRLNYLRHIYDHDASQQQRPSFMVLCMTPEQVDQLLSEYLIAA